MIWQRFGCQNDLAWGFEMQVRTSYETDKEYREKVNKFERDTGLEWDPELVGSMNTFGVRAGYLVFVLVLIAGVWLTIDTLSGWGWRVLGVIGSLVVATIVAAVVQNVVGNRDADHRWRRKSGRNT
ncbi:hypothetical protein [Marinicauda salina]|uniref:hypothetical protein n=1 Tax=Marinicauda salina TaxID=2135793 RepID=UPI0011B24AF9|nr:hypothetical protein [Marinicauda salina]